MIDKIGRLVVLNFRFQVWHAVLNRRAINQHLWNRGALNDIEGSGRNLITDLSGDRKGTHATGALIAQLAEIENVCISPSTLLAGKENLARDVGGL